MFSILFMFFLFLSIDAINSVQQEKLNTFCNYWSKSSAFEKHEINKQDSLCTYIIYNSVGVSEDGNIKSLNPHFDLEENNGRGYIKKLNDKKKYNRELKTLAAIGRYSDVLKNENNINRFAKSTSEFLKKHGFNGLVYNWPYSGMSDDLSIDTFISVLKKLKQEFVRNNLILVVVYYASKSLTLESSYITDISKNSDYIYLVSHTLYRESSSHVGIATALYLNSTAIHVDSIVSGWIKDGVPSDKIIMGFSLFDKTFILSNKKEFELDLRSDNAKVCQNYNTSSWLINGTKMSYQEFTNILESRASLNRKAKYAMDKKLGGVGILALNLVNNKKICFDEMITLKELNTHLVEDSPRFEYIMESRIIKTSLDDEYTQCMYRTTKKLQKEDLNLLKMKMKN